MRPFERAALNYFDFKNGIEWKKHLIIYGTLFLREKRKADTLTNFAIDKSNITLPPFWIWEN